MVEAALVVENLTKFYRPTKGAPQVHAVNGVSFEVPGGKCLGLLGPNGAGKSTTIQCITGFFPPTSGSIRILGYDVNKHPKEARQILGVCSQDDNLDTDFDVLDQMVRYASFFRIDAKKSHEEAWRLLKKFKLDHKAHQLVESLSGGMRRKLQVARAMVSSPKVLVLDEPTTGLDPDARRILWDVLVEAREQGTAILLSTHYMEEAERLCDRIAILHQGKLLDVSPPKDLIQNHIGSDPVEEEIRPGVRWKRPPNLEDVFMKLAGSRLGEK